MFFRVTSNRLSHGNKKDNYGPYRLYINSRHTYAGNYRIRVWAVKNPARE